MLPHGHKDHVPTSDSQSEIYEDLAVLTHGSAQLHGIPSTDPIVTHEIGRLRGDPPTSSDNEQDTTVSHFLDLPRELRDMVYGYLLCGTKILFSFQGMKVHALYDSGLRYKTDISTTLPSWWLTNKMMITEGIEHLQRCGEIVVELEHGGILLNTPRHPPSPYKVPTAPTAQTTARVPKEQALIDFAKFHTLTLYSPSPTASFTSGSQCFFTRKHRTAIRRLAEFLENKGQRNEFRTLNIELVGNYRVDQRMPDDIEPLNKLAGRLSALQVMLVAVKECDIHPHFATSFAWRLDLGWFRLMRELASKIFGEDGWQEQRVLNVDEGKSIMIGVLGIEPKST